MNAYALALDSFTLTVQQGHGFALSALSEFPVSQRFSRK